MRKEERTKHLSTANSSLSIYQGQNFKHYEWSTEFWKRKEEKAKHLSTASLLPADLQSTPGDELLSCCNIGMKVLYHVLQYRYCFNNYRYGKELWCSKFEMGKHEIKAIHTWLNGLRGFCAVIPVDCVQCLVTPHAKSAEDNIWNTCKQN
jgi:hypothetical protein